jgi:glycosyltransferase involved in cell wall biosynthesis
MRGLFKPVLFNSISLPLIRKVESVRVVSRHLAREMEHFVGLPNSRIVVAPIPMAWFPEDRFIRTDGFHIAVIGRFHEERNISEVLSILNAVLPNQDLKKVTFAGSGELFRVIESWSRNSPQSGKIEIVTGLNTTNILKLLSGTDALLSAAMTEGYGLSIREALVSGVTVVARKNEGTEEVLEDFNSGIYLYDKMNLAVEIINKLIRHEFSGPSVNSPAIQKVIDINSMTRLASSWSQLSNSV